MEGNVTVIVNVNMNVNVRDDSVGDAINYPHAIAFVEMLAIAFVEM